MRSQRRILQSVLPPLRDFKFMAYKSLHRACSGSLALSCAARLSGYDPLCSILGHKTPSVLPTRKFTRFSSTSHLRQYDRSGRSTGTAFITYSTMGEAIAARKNLDGQLAKGSFLSYMSSLCGQTIYVVFYATGQELSIRFENIPSGPRGGAKPSGRAHSLLERVQKPSLAARLSEAGSNTPSPRFVHVFTPSFIFSALPSRVYLVDRAQSATNPDRAHQRALRRTVHREKERHPRSP